MARSLKRGQLHGKQRADFDLETDTHLANNARHIAEGRVKQLAKRMQLDATRWAALVPENDKRRRSLDMNDKNIMSCLPGRDTSARRTYHIIGRIFLRPSMIRRPSHARDLRTTNLARNVATITDDAASTIDVDIVMEERLDLQLQRDCIFRELLKILGALHSSQVESSHQISEDLISILPFSFRPRSVVGAISENQLFHLPRGFHGLADIRV